jgi:uncharacterized glyoxalase superfamily protein PhnB
LVEDEIDRSKVTLDLAEQRCHFPARILVLSLSEKEATPVADETEPVMRLVQSRIVTDDVPGLATFYAALAGVDVVLNDYYLEIPALTMGLSQCRFSAFTGCGTEAGLRRGEIVLDFSVADVDREFERIGRFGVDWVHPPADQPWGTRAMTFRDPEGHPLNVFSRLEVVAP